MAERISQQLSGLNLEGGYSTVLIRAVRTAIAPLTAITPAMLRDEGLGRQSFAEAQLGLSVSEAVTVLAINLVALKQQVEEALVALDGGLLLPAYPPAPAIPKDGGKKVARTAIALKRISGCDRHVGSRSTLSDNKAGKTLVSDIKRRLAVATALPVFEQLRLLPREWSR